MGAAQLASWVLTSALWKWRPKKLVYLFIGAVGITVAVGLARALVLGAEHLADLDSWLGSAFYIVGLAMLIASFLLTISYLPFGSDLLFWMLHADVTAGPSPKGYQRTFQAISEPRDGLAHSVYNDPKVIKEVVKWIRGVQPQPAEK